jgi:hypothetical protein
MSTKINEDSMSLEINGTEITAVVRLDRLWRVTGWPRLLSRNEAITALTLAARLTRSHACRGPDVVGTRRVGGVALPRVLRLVRRPRDMRRRSVWPKLW